MPTESGETFTISYKGSVRTYHIYIPANIQTSTSIPLVLSFHGGGGNGENQMRVSNFNSLAHEVGFIVVYPNGSGRYDDRLLTWNGGGCCGYAQQNNIDDVGFIRSLVLELESQYAIDRKRVYATGFSNGGIMSYRLACEASDIFAAIAPVSATLQFDGCNPDHPVSIIHIHGTEDKHLPFKGGQGVESLAGVDFNSVAESLSFWIQKNQCPSRADQKNDGEIIHLAYAHCYENTAVELYEILGGGHAWPGSERPAGPFGDEPTRIISASRLIWDFLASHPKP
jgi:polyhydroxybutyrate depolymerase